MYTWIYKCKKRVMFISFIKSYLYRFLFRFDKYIVLCNRDASPVYRVSLPAIIKFLYNVNFFKNIKTFVSPEQFIKGRYVPFSHLVIRQLHAIIFIYFSKSKPQNTLLQQYSVFVQCVLPILLLV